MLVSSKTIQIFPVEKSQAVGATASAGAWIVRRQARRWLAVSSDAALRADSWQQRGSPRGPCPPEVARRDPPARLWMESRGRCSLRALGCRGKAGPIPATPSSQ